MQITSSNLYSNTHQDTVRAYISHVGSVVDMFNSKVNMHTLKSFLDTLSSNVEHLLTINSQVMTLP